MHSLWEADTAKCSGKSPCLVIIFGLAPIVSNVLTVSGWFCITARWRGVWWNSVKFQWYRHYEKIPITVSQTQHTFIHLTFCWPCIMQWFLVIVQLDAQIPLNVFIYLFIVLYMFRACHAHHQEKTNCSKHVENYK